MTASWGAGVVQRALKRMIDITLSAALLPVAIPIAVMSALLLQRTIAGPMLIRQPREGRGGRPFLMLKLRTMYPDAEARLEGMLADSPQAREEWTRYRRLTSDPRIVPGVGHAMRRWSIDELPQLWHVLLGEMSLIGPRPLELGVVADRSSGALAVRRQVRPGMSGLWQVSGRSEHDLDTLIAMDADYVQNWTLAADLSILLRTPAAVISRRGAY